MLKNTLSIVSAAAALVVVAVGTADASISPRLTVALRNQPTPGSTTDLYSSFSVPTIDAAGRVTFRAATTVSGAAIINGLPNALTTVVRVGDTRPEGGTFAAVQTPRQGYDGMVNVNADASALYRSQAGALSLFATAGQAAPNDGTFNDVFGGLLIQGGANFSVLAAVNGTPDSRIYTGTAATTNAGQLTEVARVGDLSPIPETTYAQLFAPTITDNGYLSFVGVLSLGVGGASPDNRFVLFANTGSGLQVVSRGGDPLPGNPGLIQYSSFNLINGGLDRTGRAVFRTEFVAAGTQTALGMAIVSGTVGNLTTVIKTGDLVDGVAIDLTNLSTRFNANGQYLFSASVIGAPSTSNDVFVTGTAGNFHILAREGDLAPGLAGATIGGIVSTTFGVTFNADGAYALLLPLISGTGGVTTANNSVLLAGINGDISIVARKGDTILVDGVSKIIATLGFQGGNFSDANSQAVGLSDSGDITYRLTFTDGTSGIFSNHIAIPEPSSLTLLATAGVALMRRRR